MTIHPRLTFLALLAPALLAGCNGDGPAAPAASNLDAAEAQQWTGQVLEMINDMVLDVPSIAAGDFVPAKAAKAEGDPVWDEAQQAWTFDAVVDFSEGQPPTVTGQLQIHVWVQFRNAGGPLPTALGATEFEYRYAEGLVMHAASEEGSADIDFAAETAMVVAWVEGGYAVDAAGSAAVDARQSAGGRTETLDFAMAWGVDLGLPLGGCPGGTVWVDADPYRLDAVYDGQGNVAWSLAAPGYAGSGSDVIPCGTAF